MALLMHDRDSYMCQKSEFNLQIQPLDPIKTKRGGLSLIFFVKLDFKIEVDQETRTKEKPFGGVYIPNAGLLRARLCFIFEIGQKRAE